MAVWIIVASVLIVIMIIVAVLGVVMAGTGEREWSSRMPRLRRLFHRAPDDGAGTDES
jgi:threonine/homoserine/homoserine lactone efflux protein